MAEAKRHFIEPEAQGVVKRRKTEGFQFLVSKRVRPANESRRQAIRSEIAHLVGNGFFNQDEFIQDMAEYLGGLRTRALGKNLRSTFNEPIRTTLTSDPLPIPGFGGTVTFVSQKHKPGESYHSEAIFRVPRTDHDDILVISSGYSSGYIDSSKPNAGVFDSGPYSHVDMYTTPSGGDFFQKREWKSMTGVIDNNEWLVAVANAAFGIKRHRVGQRLTNYEQTGESMRETIDALARGENVRKGTHLESSNIFPGTEKGITQELSRLMQTSWEKSDGPQVLHGVGEDGHVRVIIPARKGDAIDFTGSPVRIDFMDKRNSSRVESSYFIQQDPYVHFHVDIKRRVIEDPTDLIYDVTRPLPRTERVEEAEAKTVHTRLQKTQTIASSRN